MTKDEKKIRTTELVIDLAAKNSELRRLELEIIDLESKISKKRS